MHNRRYFTLLSLLVVLAMLLVAGCAPRIGGGEIATAAGDAELAIDLPSLVITYDSAGQPSIAGQPLAALDDAFSPGLAEQLVLPPAVIDSFTAGNIQHVQVVNGAEGLSLFVNGEAIPGIAWDGDILQNTGATVSQLVPAVPPALQKLLPVLARLGVGVSLQFPVAEGAGTIPPVVEGQGTAAAEASAAQEAFLTSVGEPPRINVPIYYNADGTWTLADLSEAEYMALLPQVPWQSLHLDPNFIRSATAAGITKMGLATDAEGLRITLNDSPLPYLDWSDGKVQHLLAIANDAGWLNSSGGGMSPEQMTQLVNQVLPALQASEVTINLFFPTE